MITSEAIDLIAPALVLAQRQVKGAAKTATNPHLKNKYATLADIYDACGSAMNAADISILQTTITVPGGIEISTRLLHKSGQWIEGRIAMPIEKATAQGVGSAVTYGRRYSLAAIAGVVADEDDDGNAASVRAARRAPEPPPTPAKPKSWADVSDSSLQEMYLRATGGADPDEKKATKARAEAARRGLTLLEPADDPTLAQVPPALVTKPDDLPF